MYIYRCKMSVGRALIGRLAKVAVGDPELLYLSEAQYIILQR